ncbi:hypothetical protein K1719_006529 [Acacia pycnantha]|nr:hypothetical protein K1719_006529 [Acacia pycnantha]
MTPEPSEKCEKHENAGSNLEGSNEYVKLAKYDEPKAAEAQILQPQAQPRIKTLWWWFIVLLWCFVIIILAFVIVKWGMPFFSVKVLYPFMEWQVTDFSRPFLAIELFASLVVFPVFLIPSGPSMWLAGMSFDYSTGSVIITSGTTIGMIFTYLIGRLYRKLVHHWLKKRPRIAAIIKLATEGSWYEQCLIVALGRASPFPYTIFNYAVSVTEIRFWPYVFGSIAGMIPDGFNYICSGKLMRALADSQYSKHHKITGAIIYNIVTYGVAIVITVVILVYVIRIINKVKKLKFSEDGEFVSVSGDVSSDVMEKLSLEKPKKLSLSPQSLLSHAQDTFDVTKDIAMSLV